MKVIIYMETTANGLIAGPSDDTSFVSDRSWKNFLKLMEKVGNNVMGRRTFEIAIKEKRFPYDVLNVVMTSKKMDNKWGKNVVFTSKSPKEVVRMLKGMGFRTVLVGGGMVNASFMEAGIVDELWLDVEPVAFGRGINLFHGSDFEARLKLIDAKRISKNEVRLRYKVLK